AIFTYKDFDDPARREELIKIAIDCWSDVAEHARAAGLSYMFWEPMSIGREFGETICACLSLQERLTAFGISPPGSGAFSVQSTPMFGKMCFRS
ncbi:hypothetical protein ACC810_37970, partial [Rhizobium ruizarguesonis]